MKIKDNDNCIFVDGSGSGVRDFVALSIGGSEGRVIHLSKTPFDCDHLIAFLRGVLFGLRQLPVSDWSLLISICPTVSCMVEVLTVFRDRTLAGRPSS